MRVQLPPLKCRKYLFHAALTLKHRIVPVFFSLISDAKFAEMCQIRTAETYIVVKRRVLRKVKIREISSFAHFLEQYKRTAIPKVNSKVNAKCSQNGIFSVQKRHSKSPTEIDPPGFCFYGSFSVSVFAAAERKRTDAGP